MSSGRKTEDGEPIGDSELLRRYVFGKSENAFAELVRRHLDLVYSVALRQVGGDAHLAQDVAQVVFTALARKAASLAERPVLGGWLYRTTQFAAIDAVRAESRRRARESEATTMHESSLNLNPGAAVDWERLRPALDQVIGELADDDRDAVVLRFFEGKDFADVGKILKVTDNAARMRVERALDKLHALLARRGVTSTSAALALALANQAGVAAPAGLAASVTGAAMAGAAAGAGAVGWGLTGFMGTKTTVGIVGALVIAGVGTAWWGTSEARKSEEALAAATQERAALSAKLTDLETQAQGQARRVEAAEAENARLLAAAEKLKTPPPAAPAEVVTSGTLNTRYRRAQEIAKTGDPAEALRELLWCFDVGMPQITGMSGVRLSVLLSDLAKLGERYPAALEALRERRDQARLRLLANQSETTAAQEFGSINRALKDDAANVALLEQLPPGDRRRRGVALGSYDYLVEARRYKDAAEARPYSAISSSFERSIQERPLPATVPNPEELRRQDREYLVSSTAKSIEMLAGAGDLEHARTLAQRLLAYDNTESTKALIQKHAERAGQPALFAPAPRPAEGKP